ncbi:MAG TPA: FkbM family methyltransferase, partial [Chitinophagaceae bacterium]|nr:FkbM family methyltransferase [Chitinophagaceae bacterium]
MTSRLPNILKGLGLSNGLKFYSHTKFKGRSPIQFSFLKYPVYIRNIKSDATMFEQIFVNKEYDIKVPFKPEVIIDLGANVGYASVLFANRFPKAKIFALEPEDNNFGIAQKNVQPYNNITLIKGAVWDKPEQINVVDNGYGEAAFMIEPGEGKHPVRAYTITEIMQITGMNYIDILKIDIEGSEKEIFENGYEDWVPVTKIMIAETHDRYKSGTSKALFSAIGKYDFSLEISG